MTGALNRRLFDDLLEQEVARAHRLTTNFSLVCFDIDDFKSLNDTHGHAAGDAVLARVAAACRHTIRATDTLFRIGGEEFVIFLPAASVDAAANVAERLRGVVASQRVMLEGIPEFSGTISLGIAALDAANTTTANTTPKVLLARGDDAMYAAEKAGRDRVRIHSAEM